MKSKSKSLVQKDQNQNQNHAQGHNATFATQHLCAKIQRNYAVIQCAKMHTDTQYSVTWLDYCSCIVFMTSLSKVYNNNLQRS